MRPYADTMRELIAGVGRAAGSGSVRLPLLQQREQTSATLVIPLTGGIRGLAGAFNAQVTRRAFAVERELADHGTDGALARCREARPFDPDASVGAEHLRRVHGVHRHSRLLGCAGDRSWAAELFVEGEVDRVVLVYNTFVSALTQTVTEQEILPISADDPRDRRGGAARRRAPRRLHLRARARGDPRAAAARLRRDADLPRAARVRRLRAGRAHDGDAERLEERRRADRHADARDEPRPPGRDHRRRSWRSWPGPMPWRELRFRALRDVGLSAAIPASNFVARRQRLRLGCGRVMTGYALTRMPTGEALTA